MENVSVVIPSYKSETLISRTIMSILNAGVLPSNIFVIEDGVFDSTREVLEKIPGINHISYEQNKGAPYARNLGLSKVETEYVMFIDSDDFVSEFLIIGLVNSAEANNADIAFGPWRLDGDSIPQGKLHQPSNVSTNDWVLNWLHSDEYVPTCSVLWKTEKVVEIGKWNEKLKRNQDAELAIRGLMSTTNLSISDQGYSTYWQHESEFRVSKASIEDILFASNLLYINVLNWINGNKALKKYSIKLGHYCCKTAWEAQAAGLEILSNEWLSRAESLNYKSKGYDNKTKYLSSLFGFRYAVSIHSKLKYVKKAVI